MPEHLTKPLPKNAKSSLPVTVRARVSYAWSLARKPPTPVASPQCPSPLFKMQSIKQTRRLKSFPWDALVYRSIMAFYLNFEKLGKPERCVML